MPIPASLPPIPPVAHGLADHLRDRAIAAGHTTSVTTEAIRLGWQARMIAVYNEDPRQAQRFLQALAVLGDTGAIRGLIEQHKNGPVYDAGQRVATPNGHGTVTDRDPAEKSFFGVPSTAVPVLIDGDDEDRDGDRYYEAGDLTHLGHDLRVGDDVIRIDDAAHGTRGTVVRVDDPPAEYPIHVRDEHGTTGVVRPSELRKVASR